jgi:hypothetical protein
MSWLDDVVRVILNRKGVSLPVSRGPTLGFRETAGGRPQPMQLPLLLIVIGIVLALVVNYALGIICVVIGLVLLLWPRISAGRAGRSRI